MERGEIGEGGVGEREVPALACKNIESGSGMHGTSKGRTEIVAQHVQRFIGRRRRCGRTGTGI